MKKQVLCRGSILLGMVLCLLLLPVSVVSAEKKIYNGTGEYTMSDYETPNVAEQRALMNARNHVLEQAGVFVSAYTRMENMNVTDDNVNMITTKALKITNQSQRKLVMENGDVRIIVEITAEVDTADIDNIQQREHLQRMIDEKLYRELRMQISKDERETAEIKKKIADLRGRQEAITDMQIELKTKELKRLSYQKVYDAVNINDKTDEQIVKLKEAISLYPQNTLALEKLAAVQLVRKDYDEGVKVCNRILVIDDKNCMAYLLRGRENYMKTRAIAKQMKPGDRHAYMKENLMKSLQDYNAAFDIDEKGDRDKLPFILIVRSDVLRDIGDYKNALTDLNKAIQVDNDDESLYLSYGLRGMVYGFLGDYHNAILDYNKSIQLNSKYMVNYVERARIYQKIGNIDKSINDCEKAINLGSEDEDVYCIRGMCYLQKGIYAQANDDFDKALSINKDSGNVYYCRGDMYSLLNKYDEAIENYNKAVLLLEEKSNLSLVYTRRGIAYVMKGDVEQAIKDFERSLELDPNTPNAAKALELARKLKKQDKK